MKLSSSRVRVLVCLLSIFSVSQTLYARDTERVAPTKDSDTTRYEKRVERYKEKWLGIIPTHLKAQFAGSMGLMSFGFGWDYGRRNQWETDLLIGFLPKFSTSKFKVTTTLKQNYMPWNISLGSGGFSMEPLTCGVYINTIWGGDYWRRQPSKYPTKYYTFSTKLRFNVFIGQRFTYTRPGASTRKFTRSITLFYEISTSDFYIMSAVQNSYLKPSDFLSLSFGMKLQIF